MQVKSCYIELGLTSICDTLKFTIDVKNPCLTDTLTISATIFTTPALTYNVKTAASTLSWTDADVTSDGGFKANCGDFTWTVIDIGGGMIDKIFTVGDLT